MSDHTPTPWAFFVHDSLAANPNQAAFLVGPERRYQDRSLGFSPNDAAFIIRAVNSHQALVEALEGCLQAMDTLHDWGPNTAVTRAEAALKLAKA